MTQKKDISMLAAWILAARPKTLPAAMGPVIVGMGMAIADQKFVILPALAALAGALLLQIGVNIANDYFDYRKGIDTPDRLGPVRVTQSGLISPGGVLAGMVVTFGCASLIGFYLISVAGWPLLIIGVACILAALAYSGGPYPLGSHGYGDLLVFIFFGPVPVCGTYYAQALDITWYVILASVPIGLLITAILVVNNVRDIETDRASGKKSLAVMLGEKGTRIEYLLLMSASYLFPLAFWLAGLSSPWVLLPILSLPMALYMILFVWKKSGEILNQALARTAQVSLIFSLLLAMGLIL